MAGLAVLIFFFFSFLLKLLIFYNELGYIGNKNI